MADTREAAEARLRDEVASLPVAEILALCYAFQHKRERLRLYLDVLRKRGGERAQFASTLICFDLARQGDATFQQEFVFLADTMIGLARNVELVSNLIGEDPYLSFLWELCQAQLEEMDPRFEADQMEAEATDFAALDLISDDDFADFDDLPDLEVTVEDPTLLRRFDEAVEAFLGGEIGMPVYDPEAGFRVSSGRDVERVETFLRELDSLRSLVPIARGFRALVLLFYGTHMRSKKIFGAINKRKAQLLRDGVAEFAESAPDVWEIAGVLGPLHSTPEVWNKSSDILLDYVRWLAAHPDQQNAQLEEFDIVERLVERQPLMGNRRRGGRD